MNFQANSDAIPPSTMPQSHQCVHRLFEDQAGDTPDAIAAVYGDTQLTYRELNARANCLAHYLRSHDIQVGRAVGLLMTRSLDILVSILAVHKAGAAYVPLDPNYPQERLNYITDNSNLSVLLTHAQLTPPTAATSIPTIQVDAEWHTISNENSENPDTSVTLDDLAYIIYTSGSTGIPKGVAMEHRPLSNLILWHKQGLQDYCRATLGFASFSFDVSTQEFFSTCCTGGTFYIASDELRMDFEQLVRYVDDHQINRVFMPYTPLYYFLEAANSCHLSHLQHIITAGEPLRLSDVITRFFDRHRSCKLHNQYGLTEVHTMTEYALDGPPDRWPSRVLIGKPIDNTSVYILDESGSPVADGDVGEIYVGGICLARGYINQPQLTSEKFLPDPYAEEVGMRMYRTGDMGRVVADGNIECLGRRDFQVKIRGFRVELGEVESALMQHPSVEHAVVIAKDVRPNTTQLFAYLVCDTHQIPGSFELHSFLQRNLPDYMIPSAFVIMDAFPMTANGKVDRKALPEPSEKSTGREYVPPTTDTERELAAIWEDVLHHSPVGIHDHFFLLGGHSILIVKMIHRVHDTFDVKLFLTTIYDHPTLKELAAFIATKREQQEREKAHELKALLDEIQGMSAEEIHQELAKFD